MMLFAQDPAPATPPAGGGGGSLFGSPIMIILILAAGFFILILPMRRQQKQQQQLLSGLKRNDKVITQSGIIGVIVDVCEKKDDDIKEDEIVIRVDNSSNTRMRILKTAIARVFPVGGPQAAADAKK
jgi:preprotein translocase subunit YajC